MRIRYNIQTDEILFLDRTNYKVIHNLNDKIIEVGTKQLPINLHEVFNIAETLMRKNDKILKSFVQSNSVTPSVFNINNNNIIENNIIEHDIYTRCHNFDCDIMEMLKEKAKGNLVDLHFFPVRNNNIDETCLRYNLRNSLFIMLQMERALQWLIGYNLNCQYIIEDCDVEATLWKVANIITNNQSIKSKLIKELMDYYKNVMDKLYIASHYNDYMWNINLFIGRDTFLKDITNFEHYDRNKYVNVYLYGDKRFYNWKSITHRVNDSICLYVPPEQRMMLKRIKNSMTGHQFHKYMESLIGKWFDLTGKNWTNLRQYMKRVNDYTLNNSMTVEVCKVAIQDFFEKLGKLCYEDWKLNNEEEEMPIKKELKEIIEEIDQPEPVIDANEPVVVETNVPHEEGLNYVPVNDWKNTVLNVDTNDPDFFNKL